MALDRPATDLEQLGVSPEPFDHVLGDVAIPSEHLHRSVSDLLPNSGGEQLDTVGIEALGGLVEVDLIGGVVDVGSSGTILRP